MRYWLSAGRGGFSLSGNDCISPEFYCIFYTGPHRDIDETVGWRVKPSIIQNKPGIFSELKSVNYLQNALNVMDAQDDGLDQGVFMYDDGTVCEGPNLNIGIITKEGVVRTPEFKECLAGCTMTRILELIPEFVEKDLLEGVTGYEQVRDCCCNGFRKLLLGTMMWVTRRCSRVLYPMLPCY
jgi:4-amino-4-deoxychorismate lyase